MDHDSHLFSIHYIDTLLINKIQEENDTDIKDDVFCKLFRTSQRDFFEKTLLDRCDEKESVYFWSGEEKQVSEKYTKKYFGTHGIFELLLELKNEYMKRLEEKRSGGVCLSERITVAIDDFEDFLNRVYDDHEENMASTTEMYFKKGSGLLRCLFLYTPVRRVHTRYNVRIHTSFSILRQILL